MSTPRSVVLERLTYTLAAPVLVCAPNLAPDGITNSAVLVAGAAGAFGTIRAAKGFEGTGRKMMRWSPLVTAMAVDLAALATPGWGWDALVAAGWAAAGCAVTPLSRTTRRRNRPALGHTPAPRALPAPTEAAPVDDGADAYTRGVRQLWERAENPGASRVVHVVPHPGTEHDLTMLVRAIEPGRPIERLNVDKVAAAFGVPVSDVRLSPVKQQPGRQGGPGWLEVHVTPDANQRRMAAPTPEERWIDRVGRPGGGAPGSRLVSRRRDPERGVTFYECAMADSVELPRVDLAKVCRGLDIKYDDACTFLMVEGHKFLISIFDRPPLSRSFPATRELLTPDAKGMFVCGMSFAGQPVKSMIWQHDKNAAAHGLILGVSRSGKTQYFAISMAAASLGGGVIWLATVRRDEKTDVLGEFIDRRGSNALYMLRMLRAAKALCEIRANMPWEFDGKPHDYKPGDPRCPYSLLLVYADEFMMACNDAVYGREIQTLGDDLTVTGLKYGIGFFVAGQSPFAHNGFSTEMKDNLKQNGRPIIFKMGSGPATRKAAEGCMENVYDVPTIPARYAGSEGSALQRVMTGEADPEDGVSTGGVAIIVLDNGRAVLMRALYADFDAGDLHELFPDEINRLTPHEIQDLEARDLWGDWNRPDEDLEDLANDLDEYEEDRPKRGRGKGKGKGDRNGRREDVATTAGDALALVRTFDRQ
ncbi:chromosome segregation protein ParM [Embleya sp. NBC_00896]|uniref:chromosome segregation protein ParM n=1 Tax=Embleya sp. NBC_00896 TaxID=2975961 RepID=UPI002F91BE5E|nr:type IV secretory system conjugative DNA transfer family protein [Embleya sp. NBC_00896]